MISRDPPPRIAWRGSGDDGAALVCFPSAGSDGSLFRDWSRLLAGVARVGTAEMPGRGRLFGQSPLRRVDEAVAYFLPAIRELRHMEYALFGYSMGALIAFEIAHALEKLGGPSPFALLVAAHRAPDIADSRPAMHALPDADFVRELARYDGTPRELLDDAELLALLVPPLRADFELCETYVWLDRPPLPTPIAAYGGTSDDDAGPADLAAWGRHTSADFTCRFLPGGHFFIRNGQAALVEDVRAQISALHPQWRRSRAG